MPFLRRRWLPPSATEQPFSLLPLWLPALEDAAAVEQAAIGVENIQGPVLFISGEDDQVWPSSFMADQAMQRLRSRGHPYPDEHRRYADAGHWIGGPPNRPATVSVARHPIGGGQATAGGKPKAVAFARSDGWRCTLEFFARHLGTG